MTDKKQLIAEILEFLDVPNKLLNRQRNGSKITYASLLAAISNDDKISLKNSLISESSSPGIANMTKALFPDRPRTCSKLSSWLLNFYLDLIECPRCKTIKNSAEFSDNLYKLNGFNTYCKTCHKATSKETQNARQSKYRASKLNRTMSWTDLEAIKKFYKNCPDGYHVDHIIPLQGELVSGLHVENNLQYLPSAENCAKSNRYCIV